ncbi:alpha/beta hydrolase family protein [Acidovorax temperans]|uniref:alpha/beta hydrolase family protein n=1 Tax=Acidovorax temperans TaxID=80878 RepID=UPI0035B3529D
MLVQGPPALSANGELAAWLVSGSQAPQLVLYDVRRHQYLKQDIAQAPRCRGFSWSALPTLGIAVSHGDGNEDDRLYLVNTLQGVWRPVQTHHQGRQTLLGISSLRPHHLLIAESAADSARRDYLLFDLRDGGYQVLLENSPHSAVYFDQFFMPRLYERLNQDASRDVLHVADDSLFLHIPHADALHTRVLGFDNSGAGVFVVRPEGARGAVLQALRCQAGQVGEVMQTLHHARAAEIVRLLQREDGTPAMIELARQRSHLLALDVSLQADLRHVRRQLPGEIQMLCCRHEHLWLLGNHSVNQAQRYHLYDVRNRRLHLLQALPELELAAALTAPALRMRHVCIRTRDGQQMQVHLCYPRDSVFPLPAILLAHGGPWRHSRAGYDARRIALASQGWLVLEPNFRASTGWGRDWTNAGDGEWGGAMQADLEDVLDWAVTHGYAEQERMALVGGSYGGYAVLQMAASSARPIRAVVALSPLTDLCSFVETPPAYWESTKPMLQRRIGDPREQEQRHRMHRRSPLFNAGGFQAPVLLAHGKNDSRIPAAMTSKMLLALAQQGKHASMLLFTDEGHEIVGSANRYYLQAVMCNFLREHMDFPAAPNVSQVPPGVKQLFTPKAQKQWNAISGGEAHVAKEDGLGRHLRPA